MDQNHIILLLCCPVAIKQGRFKLLQTRALWRISAALNPAVGGLGFVGEKSLQVRRLASHEVETPDEAKPER